MVASCLRRGVVATLVLSLATGIVHSQPLLRGGKCPDLNCSPAWACSPCLQPPLASLAFALVVLAVQPDQSKLPSTLPQRAHACCGAMQATQGGLRMKRRLQVSSLAHCICQRTLAT